MSNTYKDKYGGNFFKKTKIKKSNKKTALKQLPKQQEEDKDHYNNMDLEDYDEGNFEKFSRRRWLCSKYL